MSEIKLLPCPFCGGEAYMDKFYESCDGRQDKAPKVNCKECGSSISMSYEELWKLDDKFGHTGGYRSNNKELLDGMHQFVAEKWNTRKPMERIIERLEEKIELHKKQSIDERLETSEQFVQVRQKNCFVNALKIVKEEGGIE